MVVPDTAAEQEKGNPKCGECGKFPTNHFCTFVLDSGEICRAPVCAICKWDLFNKEVQDPTRCSAHFRDDDGTADEPPPLPHDGAGGAPHPLPPSLPGTAIRWTSP